MRAREPMQIGAELYGHAGIESDLEIQRLMLQALASLGIDQVHLDLGHVGVFRALVRDTAINEDLEDALFNALQHKDTTTLRALVQNLPEKVQSALMALVQLSGGIEVIAKARKLLPADAEVGAALDQLETVATQLQPHAGNIGIDLAELRGYHYHSGMVFAAYHAGSHDAIALGGRYDDLGKSFGRARPATGFSMDLRQLVALVTKQTQPQAIYAPHFRDVELDKVISELRKQGNVVVVDLLGKAEFHSELNCDRQLLLREGKWVVVEFKE